MARLRRWVSTPTAEAMVEEHRQTVLFRSKVSAWIAAVVIPFTIFVYVLAFQPQSLGTAIAITAAAELGVILVLVGLQTELFRRHFHLPFFLLVGIVCEFTESAILQLTGGGAQSNFLFPYFLVLFGVAALFPSRSRWAVAAVVMAPVTYVVGELFVQGSIESGPPIAKLILLADYAFIAAIANRVTTRIFFSEVENRLALEVANKQLRELDKAKSDFFANLSHDLRSPLTVILGPLSAIVNDPRGLDGQQRAYLDHALRGATRLDAMINDLLELARIDAGVGKLELSRIDLAELAEGLVQASRPYAASRGVVIELDAPPYPVMSDVDADKMERVLMNLLSNACKFSSAGTVTVRVREEAGVVVSVSDFGRGIALDDVPRLFNRFSRGKDESTRRTSGAGLGLAVVKEFVELHGGTVSVESELGKGSTFTVRLPPNVASAEPHTEGPTVIRSRPPPQLLLPPVPGPLPEPTPSGVKRPRLLLIEDSEELRSFLSSELASTYEVEAAEQGEAGLVAAHRQRPDLVVADVMLPGIDGIEVCRRLRDDPSTATLPILVFSARGDIQTRLDAFGAGADDFVHKPLEPRELKARLDSLLRRSRSDERLAERAFIAS
jgi:signal transduction histidine kinase/CheY-like chemotaxis protein